MAKGERSKEKRREVRGESQRAGGDQIDAHETLRKKIPNRANAIVVAGRPLQRHFFCARPIFNGSIYGQADAPRAPAPTESAKLRAYSRLGWCDQQRADAIPSMSLLTPQLIERLNAQQRSFGEKGHDLAAGLNSAAAAGSTAPQYLSSSTSLEEKESQPVVESSSSEKKKQRGKKKKKEQLEHYAYSVFQISPDPQTLPVPRFITKR